MNNENKCSSGVKLGILCLAEIAKNPRPNRLVSRLLNDKFGILTVSYDENNEFSNDHICIQRRNHNIFTKLHYVLFLTLARIALAMALLDLSIKLYLKSYFIDIKNLKKRLSNCDIVILEDFQFLPMSEVLEKSKVILDAREYYPDQNTERLRFNLFEKPLRELILSRYLTKCSANITVSQGLAEAYFKNFGVRMTVVYSAPEIVDEPVAPRLNNASQRIPTYVHHGLANKNRRIEKIISCFKSLGEEYKLHLYLVGSEEYIATLKHLAGESSNILFHQPVPLNLIIKELQKYDVGLIFFPPITFNLKHSMPNKFFEYMHAKLPVVIGPSPDMQSIVEKAGIGFVTDSFETEDLEKVIQNLTWNDIINAREKIEGCIEVYSYSFQYEKIKRIIYTLLNEETVT